MFEILLLHFLSYVLKYYHNITLGLFQISGSSLFVRKKGVEDFE